MRKKAVAVLDEVEVALWMDSDEGFHASGRKKAAQAAAEKIRTLYQDYKPTKQDREDGAWLVMTRKLKKMGWQIVPVRAFRRLVH